MSDEPGFHEVQLSGKQLVFLFMSAVVLMVVVFLLGVNVGRGVRNAVGDTEVSAQTDPAAAQPADDAVASLEPTKPKPAELSYHDMLLGATPAGDKGSAAEKAPPSVAPPPISEEPPPPPAPAATPVRTPAPTPTPALASAPKANRSDWFVQTGSYSTRAVADGQVAKLKLLKVPAFVLPPQAGSGDKLFRVRIGPYADRAEAQQVSSRIARQGHKPLITR
jgi:cell division protein FtsN